MGQGRGQGGMENGCAAERGLGCDEGTGEKVVGGGVGVGAAVGLGSRPEGEPTSRMSVRQAG